MHTYHKCHFLPSELISTCPQFIYFLMKFISLLMYYTDLRVKSKQLCWRGARGCQSRTRAGSFSILQSLLPWDCGIGTGSEHPQSSAVTQKDTAGEGEGSPVAFSSLPLPAAGLSWDFGFLGPLPWLSESPSPAGPAALAAQLHHGTAP